MADDSSIMLHLNHCLATSPKPTTERNLRSRLTRTEYMITVPRGTPQLNHNRVTGPVSERWLHRTLLPRLSRRPYGTHRYFQQRMAAEGATQDMATVPTPAPQLNPHQTPQPESQLSGCQEFCANSNERALTEGCGTALHEYQERLIGLASKSLDRPHHQDTPVVSRTTYVPLALLEPLSPTSTIENTEEEYEAAVELCLSSHSLSSVKRRNDTLPGDRIHKRFDGRSSKRIRTIGVARKDPEELGAVEATAVGFEDQDEFNSVRPRKSTSGELELSESHTEDHHFSQIDTPPDTFAKPASAKACLEGSEAHGEDYILPRFRPLYSMSDPVHSIIQTLARSSIPPSSVRKDTSEEKIRPVTFDQNSKNKPDPQCADIRLSQVIKGRGTFLDPHQILCPVPGSWEDAVAFSEDTRRTAQQQAY
jgi:hypothetical protein